VVAVFPPHPPPFENQSSLSKGIAGRSCLGQPDPAPPGTPRLGAIWFPEEDLPIGCAGFGFPVRIEGDARETTGGSKSSTSKAVGARNHCPPGKSPSASKPREVEEGALPEPGESAKGWLKLSSHNSWGMKPENSLPDAVFFKENSIERTPTQSSRGDQSPGGIGL